MVLLFVFKVFSGHTRRRESLLVTLTPVPFGQPQQLMEQLFVRAFTPKAFHMGEARGLCDAFSVMHFIGYVTQGSLRQAQATLG